MVKKFKIVKSKMSRAILWLRASKFGGLQDKEPEIAAEWLYKKMQAGTG